MTPRAENVKKRGVVVLGGGERRKNFLKFYEWGLKGSVKRGKKGKDRKRPETYLNGDRWPEKKKKTSYESDRRTRNRNGPGGSGGALTAAVQKKIQETGAGVVES